MKNNIIIVFATMIILSCSAQGGNGAGKTDVKLENMTTEQKASYSYGVLIADNLKKGGIENLDAGMIAKGIQDVLEDKELQVDFNEAQTLFQAFASEAQEKLKEQEAAKFLVNKDKGAAFLTENGKKEGVVSLDNGMQYKILTAGNGPKPALSDQVEVHYHGTLTDGTVFDSSVDRGTPAEFGLTQVIKGWTEILQLMPVGSKWTVYIPEDLAYGANPRPGGPIEPYMALIFDIELISIK